MSKHTTPKSHRRVAPFALLAGVAATGVLALSMNGTLAGFAAQITNNNDSVATGTLTMQESNATGTVNCNSTDGTGNTVSTNTYTCASINKYGGSTTLIPGQTLTTQISIKDTGSVDAKTFTLSPGACTQANSAAAAVNGSATDLCAQIGIVVTETVGTTTTTVTAANATLASISGKVLTLPALTAGTSASFSFAVTLPSTAGNTYQGLQASQPLVWNFSS